MKLRDLFISSALSAALGLGACSEQKPAEQKNSEAAIKDAVPVSPAEPVVPGNQKTVLVPEPNPEPELTTAYCSATAIKGLDTDEDVRNLSNCEAPEYFSEAYEAKCYYATTWQKVSLDKEGRPDPDVNDASNYFANRATARYGTAGPSKFAQKQAKIYSSGPYEEDILECTNIVKGIRHAPYLQ